MACYEARIQETGQQYRHKYSSYLLPCHHLDSQKSPDVLLKLQRRSCSGHVHQLLGPRGTRSAPFFLSWAYGSI
jgi:hypothetical protein